MKSQQEHRLLAGASRRMACLPTRSTHVDVCVCARVCVCAFVIPVLLAAGFNGHEVTKTIAHWQAALDAWPPDRHAGLAECQQDWNTARSPHFDFSLTLCWGYTCRVNRSAGVIHPGCVFFFRHKRHTARQSDQFTFGSYWYEIGGWLHHLVIAFCCSLSDHTRLVDCSA